MVSNPLYRYSVWDLFDRLLQMLLIMDKDLCDRGGTRTHLESRNKKPTRLYQSGAMLEGGRGWGRVFFFFSHTLTNTQKNFLWQRNVRVYAGSTGLCLLQRELREKIQAYYRGCNFENGRVLVAKRCIFWLVCVTNLLASWMQHCLGGKMAESCKTLPNQGKFQKQHHSAGGGEGIFGVQKTFTL